MFWWLTKEGRYQHRLETARWDVAYARSGLRYYGTMLSKAQERVIAIEAKRVDVDFPPPRGVSA